MAMRNTGMFSRGSGSRFVAAALMSLFVVACGDSSDPVTGLETYQPVNGEVATPDGTPESTPADSATLEPVVPAVPDAIVDGGVTDPADPVVVAPPADPVVLPSFSWTEPASFRADLAVAIANQPPYSSGGYGGMVANPFPQVPGTAWFPGLQITRPDAIIFGNHFGRPSYRFYADANSRHSNGLRAEFTGGSTWRFVEGETARYEFSSYFPADYRNSSWSEWNLFAQFHGPGFPAWGLHTAGGYLHMKAPDAVANQYRIPMPARDVWHDFQWTIYWTHDSATGWATLYMDGVKVFDYRGATMHAGEDSYYPKFGAYLANNPYTQVVYTTPWVITRL